jgi:hypothetical protein
MDCNLHFEIQQLIFVTLSRILRRTLRFSSTAFTLGFSPASPAALVAATGAVPRAAPMSAP